MGLIYANVELVSVDDLAYFRRGDLSEEQVKKITVRALVDSGAYMLSINEEIRLQLDLAILDEQEAELADGSLKRVKIAGPIEIRFKNRKTTVNAVVLPNSTEVLLGAIPMEDMDLLINPRQQELIVNPAHPYLAKKSLK
ncbi:Clan AA aspartic protease, AF_0612 family [Gammaproteobacteria bacterium]